jgi:hypothetical protein
VIERLIKFQPQRIILYGRHYLPTPAPSMLRPK